MRRNTIGILAAVLLLLGGVTAFTGPGGSSAQGFAGGCIRVGLVLGAIWLAMPQIQSLLSKFPRWLLGWFVGKGKPAAPREQPTQQQPTRKQPAQQPPAQVPPSRAPRPRRRSG